MTLGNQGPNEDIPVIQEELNPELITSLMSNYSSGTDALLEIIDNSVDEIIQGKKLRIDIRVASNKEIVLIERGGRGMDAERLGHFFRWGKSEKAGREGKLGRYGQGGKAAMGYLGRSFNLTVKAAGEVQGRQIVELDWDDRSTGAKTWIPKTVPVSAPVDEGYVELRISNLNNRRLSQQTLRDRLGNIYRELIDKDKCEIMVNSEAVVPIELPLYEKFPIQQVNTSLGRDMRLSGWFGRLRADTAKHGRLKGGIRCTVHDRLIKDAEFFGHPGPEYKQSLNQLIGVIEVPFVKLYMNKSDFDRDSDEWRALERFMNKQLAPIVNELKGTREQEKITDRDRKRVREAQELFEAAAKRLEMRELLEEKYNTGAGQRRKDEPSRATGVNALSRKTRSDVGRPHLPATPPPADATGKRSRKGRMLWEPKQLGERTRAYIQPNGNSAVLYINTQYPLYKLTKGDTWYVIETGALEVAKYDRSMELSPDEYLLEVNDILAEVFATAG